MEELWVACEEFPDYSLSSFGRIANTKFHRIVKPRVSREGTVMVTIYKDGAPYTKSLKVLLGEAFVDGKTETFDTIIHLDGDVTNNAVSNLTWRPRWFAWKYKRQLSKIDFYHDKHPYKVYDVKTGLVYDSVVHAGLTNGLLFSEIVLSLHDQTPVFPTWHVFGIVEE